MRDILRDNIAALTAPNGRRPDLHTVKALAAASGISTGTIDRMRRSEADTGVDHLAGLAAALHMRPHELLIPDVAKAGLPMDLDDEERLTLEMLRAIKAINTDNYADILQAIAKMADALKTADAMLRQQHGVTGYVAPDRAAERLKPAPRKVVQHRPPSEGGLLGGMSGFDDLRDAHEVKHRRKGDR